MCKIAEFHASDDTLVKELKGQYKRYVEAVGTEGPKRTKKIITAHLYPPIIYKRSFKEGMSREEESFHKVSDFNIHLDILLTNLIYQYVHLGECRWTQS